MRRSLLLFALLAAVGALALGFGRAEADDGDRHVHYVIYRNGDRIGTQDVRLRHKGNRTTVDHRIGIRVTFLGFEAYHYDLRATETWADGRLLGLSSTVDRNGEALRMWARTSEEGIHIRRPGGQQGSAPTDAIPADPSFDVLGTRSAHMIEAEDGAVRRVTVRGPTEDMVDVSGRRVRARRYEVQGEHDATLWYDGSGLLVKKRLQASDGSTILTVMR